MRILCRLFGHKILGSYANCVCLRCGVIMDHGYPIYTRKSAKALKNRKPVTMRVTDL